MSFQKESEVHHSSNSYRSNDVRTSSFVSPVLHEGGDTGDSIRRSSQQQLLGELSPSHSASGAVSGSSLLVSCPHEGCKMKYGETAMPHHQRICPFSPPSVKKLESPPRWSSGHEGDKDPLEVASRAREGSPQSSHRVLVPLFSPIEGVRESEESNNSSSPLSRRKDAVDKRAFDVEDDDAEVEIVTVEVEEEEEGTPVAYLNSNSSRGGDPRAVKKRRSTKIGGDGAGLTSPSADSRPYFSRRVSPPRDADLLQAAAARQRVARGNTSADIHQTAQKSVRLASTPPTRAEQSPSVAGSTPTAAALPQAHEEKPENFVSRSLESVLKPARPGAETASAAQNSEVASSSATASVIAAHTAGAPIVGGARNGAVSPASPFNGQGGGTHTASPLTSKLRGDPLDSIPRVESLMIGTPKANALQGIRTPEPKFTTVVPSGTPSFRQQVIIATSSKKGSTVTPPAVQQLSSSSPLVDPAVALAESGIFASSSPALSSPPPSTSAPPAVTTTTTTTSKASLSLHDIIRRANSSRSAGSPAANGSNLRSHGLASSSGTSKQVMQF